MNTRTRNLFVENLNPRHLMAIDVAEIEPNNSESQATTFQLAATEDVVLRGNANSQNDRDYFTFTAQSSGPVAVGVSSNSGAKLEVTTRAGAQLFETEPKDGVNSGSFQTVAGTTYLLRLRASEKSAAPYAVTLSAADATGNSGGSSSSDSGGSIGGGTSSNSSSTVVESEPNDNVSQAVQLTLIANEPRTLTGAASKKDRDFFVVTPTSAGTVSIDTGSSGIKLSFETRQGTKLFEAEPNDGVTAGTFSITEGQAFIVRARGLNSSLTNYSISISLGGKPAANTGVNTAPINKTIPVQWLDASDDGVVSPLDALLVINHISRENQSEHDAAHDAVILQFDMNDDSLVSPIDALLVINHLNVHNRGGDDSHAEGEAVQARSVSSDDLVEPESSRNRRRSR